MCTENKIYVIAWTGGPSRTPDERTEPESRRVYVGASSVQCAVCSVFSAAGREGGGGSCYRERDGCSLQITRHAPIESKIWSDTNMP